MSIWTSRAAGALLLLGACVPAGPGLTRGPVLGGAMQVAAPAGYCIDRSAGRGGNDSAVVLMGKCSNAGTATPAVLSVTIGQAGSGQAMAGGGAALAAYFTSPQGRATLARSGRAADVRVLEARAVQGGVFLLRLADRGIGDYWRAVTALNGRLVTLSVTGTPDAPLDPAAGRRLIDAGLAAMKAANRPGAGG